LKHKDKQIGFWVDVAAQQKCLGGFFVGIKKAADRETPIQSG